MTIDDRLYSIPSIIPVVIGFYSYCLPVRHPSRPQCSPQRNLSHKIRSSAWELVSIFGSLFSEWHQCQLQVRDGLDYSVVFLLCPVLFNTSRPSFFRFLTFSFPLYINSLCTTSNNTQ